MANEPKFTKDQILGSNQFTPLERHLLDALLEPTEYSIKKVKSLLEKEKEREVK